MWMHDFAVSQQAELKGKMRRCRGKPVLGVMAVLDMSNAWLMAAGGVAVRVKPASLLTGCNNTVGC
jgi:hypothetical protein